MTGCQILFCMARLYHIQGSPLAGVVHTTVKYRYLPCDHRQLELSQANVVVIGRFLPAGNKMDVAKLGP